MERAEAKATVAVESTNTTDSVHMERAEAKLLLRGTGLRVKQIQSTWNVPRQSAVVCAVVSGVGIQSTWNVPRQSCF